MATTGTSNDTSIRENVSVPFSDQIPLLSHLEMRVVKASIELAIQISQKGIGEGRPAPGILMIIGNAMEILENHGSTGIRMNPFQSEVRYVPRAGVGVDADPNEYYADICSAFLHDGAVVIDGQTGRIAAQSFMVLELTEVADHGSRSLAAASAACKGSSSYTILCSADDTSKFNANLVFHLGKEREQISFGTLASPRNQRWKRPPKMDELTMVGESPFYTRTEKTNQEPASPKPQSSPEPPSPKPQSLKLYVYCYIIDINDINLVRQEFEAFLYMRVCWHEADVKPSQLPSRANKLKNFDFDDWDESIVKNPQLQFNMNHNGMFFNREIKESYWRFGKLTEEDNAVSPIIEYSFFLKGIFVDNMNLRSFPFDLLDLKIKVSSILPSQSIEFCEDKFDDVKSVLRPDAITRNSTYNFYGPISFETKASTKKRTHFSIHHTIIYCKRNYTFFFWNIYLPTFLLSVLALSAFINKPSDVNDRFSVTLTLTLVLVAYKFLLVQILPSLPFNTHVDWSIINSFIFLVLVCAQHAIVSTRHICDEDDEGPFYRNYCKADRISMIVIFLVYGAITAFLALLSWMYRKENDRFLDEKVEDWKDKKKIGKEYDSNLEKMRPRSPWDYKCFGKRKEE